jgi:gluconolactonase
VKSDGTFWFTDPPYGLPKDQPKEQPGNYVYRFDPASGKSSVLATNFDMPNGLCFSPDESRLYVADSGKPHHIRVFEVSADGTVRDGRVFCTIDVGGPDGIRCDQDGRVWSSSGDGAQIFSPDGRRIARIRLPKGAANLCFGGRDGKTLFLTARDTVYAVETKVRSGVRRVKK